MCRPFLRTNFSRGEWKLYIQSFSLFGGTKLQVISHHGATVEMEVERLCYQPGRSVYGPIDLESLFTNIISFVTQCDSIVITKLSTVHVSNPFMPPLHDYQTYFPAVSVEFLLCHTTKMGEARSKMGEEHRFGTS